MRNLITKDVILYLGFMVIVLFFGLGKIAPKFKEVLATSAQITEIKPKIDYFKRAKEIKANQPEVKEEIINLPVTVYKSKYPGLSTENASIELVDEIIQKIKTTNNSVTEVSFETPTGAKEVPEGYDVLNLNFKMRSNYLSLQSLLREIYTWQYLAGIDSVSITPEPQNKSNILVELKISLYLQK